jgi:hypothetical protein
MLSTDKSSVASAVFLADYSTAGRAIQVQIERGISAVDAKAGRRNDSGCEEECGVGEGFHALDV